MRLLVVEDNRSLAQSIARALRAGGHAVDCVGNGSDALTAFSVGTHDLVILDLSLPGGLDGLPLLRTLRRRRKDVPLLVLTARAALEDRVLGLDAGGDDYMVKPFALDELEARVRALLRRRGGARTPELTAGGLRFDTVQRVVRADGQTLSLTPRERGVLEVLMRNAGRVVSKERIAEHLFDFGDDTGLSAVELYVSRLRKRLAGTGARIRTLRGLGYLLEE